MQNDAGLNKELDTPRKCSSNNRVIHAKDHSSIQLTIPDVDPVTGDHHQHLDDKMVTGRTARDANVNKLGNILRLILGRKLLYAINDNNVQEVKKNLEWGAPVNYREKGSDGWTPLMHACSNGSKEIIELLLKYDADPNENHELHTPLMCVCDSQIKDQRQLLDCLDVLLAHKADYEVTNRDKTTALMFAAGRGHETLVLKLIFLGCNVNQADSDGWSAIFYAVYYGKMFMVQLLKDLGADITQKDKTDRTLREIATISIDKKNVKVIKQIVYVKDNKPKNNVPVQMFSDYQSMLKELPDISNKGRLYGFPNEVLRIINGIGLKHLTPLFKEKEVQLAEFLTWDDEDWKKCGVVLSFDRQKIKANVRKFHEHGWGNQSIKVIKPNEQIDLFEFAQILSNMLRQVHAMSASTLYYLKNRDREQVNVNLNAICEKGIVHARYLKKELRSILEFVKHMEQTKKIDIPDLIEPEKPKKTAWRKIFLLSSLIGVCACKHKTILNVFAGALLTVVRLTKFIK